MAQTAMQEQAREAFLTNALKTLLGQDSPTGFTENVVTAAEGIAGSWDSAPGARTRAISSSPCPAGRTAAKWGCAPTWTLWA